jgi:5-methylcytosine-specific restriction endonuclease McrA
MTDRNLTTTREQVFGDVEPGTECRICGRNVDDGRAKTCSDYCDNLLTAVMGMLNWSSVRRKVIDRDGETCAVCGWDRSKEWAARAHIRDLIEEAAAPEPTPPVLEERSEDYDWDELRERRQEWRERREAAKEKYGDPEEPDRELHVDHIEPIADGGHPFDLGNLQTLCSRCHHQKTAEENSNRTPTRGEMSESLLDYVTEADS